MNPKKTKTIPPDAILLIPEPEEGEAAPYGIKPGYYNHCGVVELLSQNKHNADAIYFIADMMDEGDPVQDPDRAGFVRRLRSISNNPQEIERLVQILL